MDFSNIFYRVVSMTALCLSSVSLYAQGWNLVWRQDFGVAEDTVIKNFPDPGMTVPNHYFIDHKAEDVYDSQGEKHVVFKKQPAGYEKCGILNDGFYGIANSTKWGVVRWKSCEMSDQTWFASGRDHTGNDNGAMLIINSNAGVGEEIYTYDPPFELCGERKYRFQIFTASITGFTAQEAILGLQVWNKTTNTLIDEIDTGEIPLWGYAGDSPHAVHDDWSEYHLDFTANPGDQLSLKVINNAKSGVGNDFVIDDISLYRWDEDVVLPDLNISEQAIASESAGSSCSYKSSFTIDEAAMNIWKSVEEYVYVLWQTSNDEGLTWTNLTAQSGIEKSKLTMDIDGTETAIFRVIVTASATAAEAEEQALYIAEHEGPKNSCSFFTISNTLASIKPEPNCKWKENLKTLWTEDFGIADTLEKKTCKEAQGTFYIDNGMDFDAGKYVVCSMPDSAVKQSNSWNKYPANEYSTCRDQRGDGGAMLFCALSKTDTVIYSKAFKGPFCNCKAYMFNFDFYKAVNWSTVPIKAQVIDGNEVIGEATAVIGGGEGGWRHITVPFQLPSNFTGSVVLKISQDMGHQYANDGSMFAIDNISVTMCGETMPKTSIGINGTNEIAEFGFECGDDTKTRTVDLYGLSGWKKEYPYASFVWQRSDDGGASWIVLNETTESINHTADAEYTLYRAVIGETSAVVQQVVGMGKPSDNCSLYYITNTVGFKCKEAGCRKPKLSLSNDMLILGLIGEMCLEKDEPTFTMDGVFYTLTSTNIDKFYYQTKKTTETVWSTEDEITPTKNADGSYTVTISGSESFDYRLWAVNDTCKSDTLEWSTTLYEYLEMKPIADTVMCEDADLELEFETVSGLPTQYTYTVSGKSPVNHHPGGFIHTTPTIAGEKKHRTVSVYASYDGVCKSEPVTFEVGYELNPKAVLTVDKATVCKGDMVDLRIMEMSEIGYADATNEYTKTLTATDNDGVRDIDMDVTTDNPTSDTEYTLTVAGKYCTTPNISTKTVTVELPQAIDLATAPSPAVNLSDPNNANVCEGTTVEFKASGENLVTWDWEVKKKGDSDFSKLEEGSTNETKSILIEDETSVRVSAPVASTNVCNAARSEVIVIKAEKKPDFVLAADKDRVCDNGTVNITVTSDLDLSAYALTYTENGTAATLGTDGNAVVNVAGSDVVCEVTMTGQYCTQSEQQSVTIVADKPVTFTASADKSSICEGDPITFTLNVSDGTADDLEWYEVTSSGDVSYTMPADLKITPADDITLYATTPVSGACEGMKSENFVLNVEKKMTVSIVPETDQKICAGTTVNIKSSISGNTPSSIEWTKNGTIFATTNNINDEPTADAIYKITVNGTECPAIEKEVKIEVESPSDLSIFADKSLVCEGESVTLTPNYGTNTPNDVKWWKQEGTGTKTQITETTTISPTTKTSYYLSVTGDVCAELFSEPVTIDVEKKVAFTLSSNQNNIICEGTDVVINVEQTSGIAKTYELTVNGTAKNVTLTNGKFSIKETPVETTEYMLTITGDACSTPVTNNVKIEVEKKPTLTFDTDVNGLCSGDAVTLTATSTNADDILLEQSTDGTDFISVGSFTSPVQLTPIQTIWYRLTTQGKVTCEERTQTKKVEVEESFDVTMPDLTEVCPGVQTKVEATVTGNPSSIVWESSTAGNSFIKAGQNTNFINVSPKETTIYRVTLSGKYCTEVQKEVSLDVSEVPTVSLEASNNHICEGDDLTIESKFSNDNFSESSIVWTITDLVTKIPETEESIQALIPSPEHSSSYKIEASTPNGCIIKPVQIVVTVDKAIDAVLTEDTTVCEGNKVKMTVTSGSNYVYEWTKQGSDSILSKSYILSVSPEESTTYIAKVINGYCTKELTVFVEVTSIPRITEITEGKAAGEFEVSAEGGTGQYQYKKGNNDFQNSPLFENLSYGASVLFTVMDNTGCSSDTLFRIPVYELVFTPVFTPDGDGINDVFKIENLEKYPTAKITIYDRTGKVLVKSTGADFDSWDGSYNGMPMPSTDYWYEIFVSEIQKTYTGHFTLLRSSK